MWICICSSLTAMVESRLPVGKGARYKTIPGSQIPHGIWRGGEVVNTAVCRTATHRFESGSRLTYKEVASILGSNLVK